MPHFEKIINYLINDYTNWVAIRLQGMHPVQQDVDDSSDDIQLDQNKADAVGSAPYIIKPAQAKLLIEAAVDIYEPLDPFFRAPASSLRRFSSNLSLSCIHHWILLVLFRWIAGAHIGFGAEIKGKIRSKECFK